MKLFGRTGGYYLFWCSGLYLVIGMMSIYLKLDITPQIQVAWISALTAPFWCPPWGRYFNLDITWDKKMFDFFRRRTAKDYLEEASNVYKLPTPKLVPPMPEVEEPKEDNKPCYQIGKTTDGKITVRMGTDNTWTQLTMTNEGVDTFIRMLEAAKE